MKLIGRKALSNSDLWHESFIESLATVIKPKISIEVGVAEGRVTRILSKNSTQVIAIDIDSRAINSIAKLKNVQGILGQSKEILEGLKNENVMPDLVFIDGDHRISQVMEDFDICFSMLKPEGFILLHDTYPRNQSFVSEINEWCGNSYLAPELVRKKYPNTSTITLPLHPGLTLIQRNLKGPSWLFDQNWKGI